MFSYPRFTGGLATLGTLFLASVASATTVEKLTTADTVAIADVIVRGTIGQPEAMKVETPQYTFWMTADTLAVDHVYVGSLDETTIKVCHPGGLTFSDGYSLDVPSGFPTHETGESVILMLEKKAGYYVITGLYQGEWELEASTIKSGEAPTIIARRGEGTAVLLDQETKQKTLPDLFEKTVLELSELEAVIQAAAEKNNKAFSPAKSAPAVAAKAAKSDQPKAFLQVNQPLRQPSNSTTQTEQQSTPPAGETNQ